VVAPGDVHPEGGLIPDDWEVGQAGNYIDLLTGFPFPSVGYTASGIRLLRGSNVKRGRTDWSDGITHYWPRIDGSISRYELREGDLVIAMDGALVGRSYARLTQSDLPALLLQRVARIRSTKVDVSYMAALVGSESFVNYVDSVKTETAIPHISPADIRRFPIPLPSSLEEQRAIAQVVVDADALLVSLDRLILKKRAVRQGALQQLLTGRTRLPGFIGEWCSKRLSDVAEIDPESLGGATPPGYQFNYISLDDVQRGTLRSSSVQTFGLAPSRARRRLRQGDVLFGTVRPNLQSHLLFDSAASNWVGSTGFTVIRCKSDAAVPGFVYAHLFGGDVSKQIDAVLTGSNYPAVSSTDVRGFTIKFPSVREQAAIATFLSDMDAEITALEARRAKTAAIKQGMMQALLTGRVRLPLEAEVAA
jgi:type I restriction enzyme, S subunit